MNHRASIFWAAVAGLFLTALTMVGSEVRLRDQHLTEIMPLLSVNVNLSTF